MLADSGIALVESYPEDFSTVSRYFYFVGRSLPINVGPSDMNAFGLMAGTTSRPEGFRAFRYNPFLSKQTLLSPLPTEPNAYGEAINSRGDVLGYSFRACGIERIGVWRGTKFQTYFVEGTPEFPIVSND